MKKPNTQYKTREDGIIESTVYLSSGAVVKGCGCDKHTAKANAQLFGGVVGRWN